MKKEDLIALGLTEEQANKVLESHKNELNGFIPKNRFDEVNEAKKLAEGQVKTLTKDLEDAKASAGDNEDLKKKLEDAIQKQKDDAKNFYTQLAQLKLSNALKLAITDAQDVDLVIGQLDQTKLKLGEDGTLTGLDEQLKTLRESKGFLFKQEKTTISGFKPNQGNNTTGGITKEQFAKMTYREKVDLYNSNQALYNQLSNEQ